MLKDEETLQPENKVYAKPLNFSITILLLMIIGEYLWILFFKVLHLFSLETEAFFDVIGPLLMAVLLIPIIYLLLYRPMVRYISELGKAERALRESEERFRNLVETTSDLVMEVDQKAVYRYVSPQVYNLLGFRPDELIGKSTCDAMPEAEDELIEQIVLPYIAQGKPVGSFEYSKIHKDGHTVVLETNWVPFFDEERSLRGFRGIARDITDRKKAEEKLQKAYDELEKRVEERTVEITKSNELLKQEINERKQVEEKLGASEQRYRLIFERSPVGIVIFNAFSRKPIDFNEVACFQLGYTREEFSQMYIEDFEVLDHTGIVKDRFEKALRGEWLNYDAKHRTKDGQIRDVQVSMQLFFLGGNPALHGIYNDITERKKAEEAVMRQAQELALSNAELEKFAYVASHDLQEPLRMVASYAHLLAKRYQSKLDADADEFIHYIVDGATRMRELINDLLALSKVGSKGRKLKPTNIQNVLDRVLINLKATIEESNVVITRDILPELIGDEIQLEQLFQNLLSNAIKFCDKKQPRIHIEAKRQGPDWLFSVRDNGIGIASDFFERIFEVFQRLHRREDYPGCGIGLAICKKIVESQGGHIWVYSEPGRGSTFYFTIPAE